MSRSTALRRGPLAGLGFAAKDLYDIAGHRTGCGNPGLVGEPPAGRHHGADGDGAAGGGGAAGRQDGDR